MMPFATVIVMDPFSTVKVPDAPFPADRVAPETDEEEEIGPDMVAPPVPLPVIAPDTARFPFTVDVGAVSVIPDELMTSV